VGGQGGGCTQDWGQIPKWQLGLNLVVSLSLPLTGCQMGLFTTGMQQGTHWNVDAWGLECGIDLWRDFRVGLYVGGVQLTQILCSVLGEVCADCDSPQDQSEVVQQWCQLIPASAMIY